MLTNAVHVSLLSCLHVQQLEFKVSRLSMDFRKMLSYKLNKSSKQFSPHFWSPRASCLSVNPLSFALCTQPNTSALPGCMLALTFFSFPRASKGAPGLSSTGHLPSPSQAFPAPRSLATWCPGTHPGPNPICHATWPEVG